MHPRESVAVPRLLHKLVALVFIAAWSSLGVQVLVLVGNRGLLPADDFVRALPDDVSFADLPTIFRSGASDGALRAGVAAGIGLAVLAFVGVLPRLALGATTFLYLSYAVLCRSFLAFQWDNLLLECGTLAALLPPRTSAPWVLFLFRVLLLKLYFESGIAKWQSHLGDWTDGSAMAFYYETAPLPTSLAWYAHHLPEWWHRLESRATLVFELGVPFFAFGPRRARLFALAVLTGFQVVNILTANYGFFSYLALALHAVLLDDADARKILRLPAALGRHALAMLGSSRVLRAGQIFRSVRRRARARFRLARRILVARLRRSLPAPSSTWKTLRFLARLSVAAAITAGYLAVSLEGALDAFARGAVESDALDRLGRAAAPLRLVSTYHLFGHITRDRVEPSFETFEGGVWTARDLRYKPGDPRRAPPFVAPHQPRVDFLLWFYGLSYERGMPDYVRRLLSRLCADPEAVQSLFAGPLPSRPERARVSLRRYHFTSPDERRRDGAYWTHDLVATSRVLRCEP